MKQQNSRKKIGLFDTIVHGAFILISLSIVIPLLLLVSISISNEKSLLTDGYRFIPKQFSFQAYKLIFHAPKQLVNAYGVTITVTVVGAVIALLMTSLLAYTMSRRDYAYRGFTTRYVVVTMLFSGGLVPFYILMTQYLHLKDMIWALIVPYLVSPFYTLVMKGFLDQIPMEIIESAKIDGSGEWRTFFGIVLPLAKPALATVGLFICFVYWNDWWLGLLFIDNPNLVPLQLLLYRVLNTIEFLTNGMMQSSVNIDLTEFPSLSTRMALTILVAGPMLIVFPFFQKYFVKGLTIGSVKG
ncbi:carbohydrate ABC transporter permease [Paenibacillus lignilyticus]|uniref:Carbohydrate ABC transporter permease n=1 Tax=Paenibacillus lignilyticus TaxID=1172615 RepID=A0ABS5CJ35_9BACL|nr:carbohydrate ABC transporter permease [Paenibacillus lignilyticus]MBP3965868.1 carbohydrate ABC transporter permease [Paenibacillus lignilyticus]